LIVFAVSGAPQVAAGDFPSPADGRRYFSWSIFFTSMNFLLASPVEFGQRKMEKYTAGIRCAL